MQELLITIAALRSRASELRGLILTMDGPKRLELRELLFRLDDVISSMERKAADAYSAQAVR